MDFSLIFLFLLFFFLLLSLPLLSSLHEQIRQQEEDEEKVLWANEEIRRKLSTLGDSEFVEKVSFASHAPVNLSLNILF